MPTNIEFWLQIVIYAISFGSLAGTLLTRLKYMEEKLEKHNKLVERTYKLESDVRMLQEHDKED